MKRFLISMLGALVAQSICHAREVPREDIDDAETKMAAFAHFEHRNGEFSLVNAYLSATAVRLGEEPHGPEIIADNGLRKVVEIGSEDGGPSALLASSRNLLLIVLRRPAPERLSKLWDILQVGLTDGSDWESGRIHSGSSSEIQDLWPELLSELDSMRERRQAVWLTGHGLGGSLAVLVACRLNEEEIPVRGIYTFGQPKIGDSDFADRCSDHLGLDDDGSPYYRVVYRDDIVPRLKPPYVQSRKPAIDALSPFIHFGSLIFIDGDGEGSLQVNPGPLETLDASSLALQDIDSRTMLTYQKELYACLAPDWQSLLPKPMRRGSGKRIFSY